MKKNLLKTLAVISILNLFNQVSAKEYVNDLATLFTNNEAIIYEINMRSFNANDKNGNGIIEFELGETSGTFLNAIDRLDELQNYGVNAIHLLPINPVGKLRAKGTAGCVYAMTDIHGIDPNLFDKKSKLSPKEQAKKFVDECHKRNIRVFADIPACGSYEMTKLRPELFLHDEKGEPIVPSNWSDVCLFKVWNENGKINQQLIDEHKMYVDMLMEIGIDGIRADVARIKPKEFWVPVIKYAKAKDPEFMFLAEVWEDYKKPPSPYVDITGYKQLLKAGFDGYYGSCINFLQIKDAKRFKNLFTYVSKKRYGKRKAIIGCFGGHDSKSPYLTSENYAQAIMYMNATLPLNPYYLDGFATGDTYMYPYNGKVAKKTYTDSDVYYAHEGQIDIFNYSRRPGGNNKKMAKLLKETIQFRKDLGKIATHGKMNMLKSSNESVIAYERSYGNEGVIVAVNIDQKNKSFAYIQVNPDKLHKIQIITDEGEIDTTRGKVVVNLPAGKAAVLRYKLL